MCLDLPMETSSANMHQQLPVSACIYLSMYIFLCPSFFFCASLPPLCVSPLPPPLCDWIYCTSASFIKHSGILYVRETELEFKKVWRLIINKAWCQLVSKGGGGRGKQFVFEMNDIHSKEEEDLSDGYILDRKRKILKPLYFISVFRFKYQRCTTWLYTSPLN